LQNNILSFKNALLTHSLFKKDVIYNISYSDFFALKNVIYIVLLFCDADI